MSDLPTSAPSSAGPAPARRAAAPQAGARGARSPITWVPTLYFAQGLPFFVVMAIATLLFKDLGVANEHCYHATFGQIMGLRNFDKRTHPRCSFPDHRLHIRSNHLSEVGPDAAIRTTARHVRQAGLDVGLRLRPGQGYLLGQV